MAACPLHPQPAAASAWRGCACGAMRCQGMAALAPSHYLRAVQNAFSLLWRAAADFGQAGRRCPRMVGVPCVLGARGGRQVAWLCTRTCRLNLYCCSQRPRSLLARAAIVQGSQRAADCRLRCLCRLEGSGADGISGSAADGRHNAGQPAASQKQVNMWSQCFCGYACPQAGGAGRRGHEQSCDRRLCHPVRGRPSAGQ